MDTSHAVVWSSLWSLDLYPGLTVPHNVTLCPWSKVPELRTDRVRTMTVTRTPAAEGGAEVRKQFGSSRERDRHTDRQTERERERERQADKQADRQTETGEQRETYREGN